MSSRSSLALVLLLIACGRSLGVDDVRYRFRCATDADCLPGWSCLAADPASASTFCARSPVEDVEDAGAISDAPADLDGLGVESSESEVDVPYDPNCVPECAFRFCGPDGCGGSCGDCPGVTTCNDQGQCVPCTGHDECGDEGFCRVESGGTVGQCIPACVVRCPDNGFRRFDGCHCRPLPTGRRTYDLGQAGIARDDMTNLEWWLTRASIIRYWESSAEWCAANHDGLPGSGWRLPTARELLSLIQYGVAYSSYSSDMYTTYGLQWNIDVFGTDPGTTTRYWAYETRPFSVDVGTGSVVPSKTGLLGDLRCVRGPARMEPLYRFMSRTAGVVVDRVTGLAWAADVGPLTTWSGAREACRQNQLGLPGSGWRLPDVRELASLYRLELASNGVVVIDPVFPEEPSAPRWYWSSTPRGAGQTVLRPSATDSFLVVSFVVVTGTGIIQSSGIGAGASFRCVRSTSDDADNDGILDDLDDCPDEPNPDQLDSDEDGIGNVCDPDSDDDGVLDDGDQSGITGDGPCTLTSGSGCDDNCPGVSNPGQENLDAKLAAAGVSGVTADGQGDACDSDDDGDGVGDEGDVFPADPKEWADADEDGTGNNADPDDDNDGVYDDGDGSGAIGDAPCKAGATATCDDNCRTTKNPYQEDLDGDGQGNACDSDVDGDGISNDGDYSGVAGDSPCAGGETYGCDDNCQTIGNADQADVDGDGKGDACE